MSKVKWVLLAFFGLALIFFIDRPSLSGPFVYDDLPDLALNPRIQSGLLNALSYNPFRAVGYFSYWAQFQMGETAGSARDFRLFNLILHWLNGILLIRLAILLAPNKKYFPALAGLWFWLNPIFLESINLISGRFDLFVSFFYLAALSCYLAPGRGAFMRPGFFLCLILALLSKEISITIPMAALLLSRSRDQRVKRLEVLAGTGIVAVFILLRLFWPMVFAKNAGLIPAWHIYFLNQNWILWFAALKTLFPVHLNFDYALGSHPAWGGILFLFNLILFSGIALRSLRKSRPGGMLLIYPLIYLPLALIPLADPFRESRLYLGSAWLILIAALPASALAEKRKGLTLVFFALALACLVSLGSLRARAWQSNESLWKDAVKKSPGKFRPVFNFANALRRKLDLDRAEQAYRWAQRIDPGNPKVDANLYLIEQARKNSEQIERLRDSPQSNPESP